LIQQLDDILSSHNNHYFIFQDEKPNMSIFMSLYAEYDSEYVNDAVEIKGKTKKFYGHRVVSAQLEVLDFQNDKQRYPKIQVLRHDNLNEYVLTDLMFNWFHTKLRNNKQDPLPPGSGLDPCHISRELLQELVDDCDKVIADPSLMLDLFQAPYILYKIENPQPNRTYWVTNVLRSAADGKDVPKPLETDKIERWFLNICQYTRTNIAKILEDKFLSSADFHIHTSIFESSERGGILVSKYNR